MILIALHRGTSPISRVIEFWTRSAYSHAEIWFWGTSERLIAAGVPDHGCIISADAKGVVKKPIPAGVWHRTTQGKLAIDMFEWRAALNTDQQLALWNAMIPMVGWKYNYTGVFIEFPAFKRHAFRKRKKSGFCSEIILEGIERANRKHKAQIPPILSRYKPFREPPESINISPTLEFVKTVFMK